MGRKRGGVTLKYITRDVDRHGNVRLYFRRGDAPKIRLPDEDAPDFLEAYGRAHRGEVEPSNKASKDSLRYLVERYYVSAAFKTLAPSTQRVRRRILDNICLSKGKSPYKTRGEMPYRLMKARHVAEIRDMKLDTPEAANSWLKAFKALFRWATLPEVDLASENPAKDIARIKNVSAGHHTWTVPEVYQYWERHPLGTKPRKALDILLFTGVRRSDVVTFGDHLVTDEWIDWTEAKGVTQQIKEHSIPILPVLRASLDACPSGHLVWLVTSFGKPFTANGFGNWFRDRCDEAGLHHCSAHGLRKAGATIAAENGASAHQLMAIYGWTNIREAENYTRKASRKRMAGDAMHLISVPLPGQWDKKAEKP